MGTQFFSARNRWQHQVEDHRVVAALPGAVQPVFAVVGDVDGEPLG
jgi:hypothetical protein